MAFSAEQRRILDEMHAAIAQHTDQINRITGEVQQHNDQLNRITGEVQQAQQVLAVTKTQADGAMNAYMTTPWMGEINMLKS